MDNNEFETTSFISNDKTQNEKKVKKREETVEANVYLKNKFKDQSLRQRFELTKEHWFSSTLDLGHFKHVLTLMVFYKFLFLFGTR